MMSDAFGSFVQRDASVCEGYLDFNASLKLGAIHAMPSVEWATDVWIRLPLVVAASAYVGAVRVGV